MRNQPCYDENGKFIGWFSRSCAVTNMVIARDDKFNFYILASKRGKGTPDPEFVGCWCLPCGYLDFNETIEQAARRETFEETGVIVLPRNMTFKSYMGNPNGDKRQNVSFRFITFLDRPISSYYLTSRYSEKDEVDDIAWIPLKKIDNYKWAFNHKDLIKMFSLNKSTLFFKYCWFHIKKLFK